MTTAAVPPSDSPEAFETTPGTSQITVRDFIWQLEQLGWEECETPDHYHTSRMPPCHWLEPKFNGKTRERGSGLVILWGRYGSTVDPATAAMVLREIGVRKAAAVDVVSVGNDDEIAGDEEGE